VVCRLRTSPAPPEEGFYPEVMLRVTSFAKRSYENAGAGRLKCGNAILCPQWRRNGCAAMHVCKLLVWRIMSLTVRARGLNPLYDAPAVDRPM